MPINYGAPLQQQEKPAAVSYGSAGSDAVPLSQQSFGAQRQAVKHAAVPDPTFVPGVGMLGPDLGGYVAGDQAAQEYKLNENKDARAEEELGITKEEFGVKKDYLKIAQEDLGIRKADLSMRQEEFGWKREDRLKGQVIEAGMQDAASKGGYSGVIDYLKTVDPAKAIAFHAEKLKLDNAIASTDVFQAVAKNEKDKAYLESYGILGKMFSAVNNAKPEDRQNLFNTMQPMLQKVLGAGAPKTIEEALPMGMLAVAQATPENQLFKSNGIIASTNSSVGKLDADINAKIKAGATPESDAGLKDMMAAREIYSVRQQKALLDKTNVELQMQQTQQQTATTLMNNTRNINKDITTASKDYIGYMDQYTALQGGFAALEKDPSNASAQGTVSTIMASMVQKGVLTDPDFSRVAYSDAGIKKILEKNVQSWTTGKIVLLSPDEVSNLSSVFDQVTKQKYGRQKIIEGQFQDTIDGNGDIIKKDEIRMPSKQYEMLQQQDKYGRIIKQYGLEQYDPKTQQQAAEAIDQGVDPEAIKQALAKQQKQSNSNAPASKPQ